MREKYFRPVPSRLSDTVKSLEKLPKHQTPNGLHFYYRMRFPTHVGFDILRFHLLFCFNPAQFGSRQHPTIVARFLNLKLLPIQKSKRLPIKNWKPPPISKLEDYGQNYVKRLWTEIALVELSC